MSGSPKYSTVRMGAAYAAREAAQRRRREEQRRAREKRRAAERARLAREAAARRERARAEAERRRAELARKEAERAAGRAAERDAAVARAHAEQGRVDERGLDEVRDLLAGARRSGAGAAAEIEALAGQLARLRERAAGGERLGGAVEELRGRVVNLSPAAAGDGPQDSATVLAGLERRLSAVGTDGAALDPDGHRRCTELLDQLRAAAAPDRQVRFEALRGTAEHALTRHASVVAQAREAARQESAEARQREAAEAARQESAKAVAAAEEAERARAAAAERQRAEEAERERVAALELALAEAGERLGAVRAPAQGVVDTAAELGDPGIGDEIGDALGRATAALAARSASAALAAVAEVEGLLPDAERRLDELELAYQRRRDLVEALRDAMTDEGFAFEGGEDEGGSFRLHFTRPTGATYETTVASEDDGTPLLVYHVDGEPDVTLHAPQDEPVCDATEALLERVHGALGGVEGFVPDELSWDGKPPPDKRAKTLPHDTSRRQAP